MKYRSQPLKISASTTSSFSDCEQRFAFERLIEDVPLEPTPIQLVFGKVVHKAHERIWREKPSRPSIVDYWLKFLGDVFSGLHGSESESSPPEGIRWLTAGEREDLSQTEIEKKEKEKRKIYMGTGRLAFEAIFLERISASPFDRTEVEFDFGPKNITIKSSAGNVEYTVSGRIDRIQFWPDGNYLILDLKTGSARWNYQRNKLVRDIQMTLYQYACEKLFGRRPKQIFIQPVTLSRRFIDQEQGRALELIRIPVEIREDPIHFENLALLIEDVRDVLNLVIKADFYSEKEKHQWQPRSNWGRMAKFTDNVRQNRFMPRIGPWCGYCSFLQLCQQTNPLDWQTYRELLETKRITPNPEIMPVTFQQAASSGQKELFDQTRLKILKSDKKSERKIKKEMLASGEFLAFKELPALAKKIHHLIPLKDSLPCPCRRLGLVSLSILENFRNYRQNTLSLAGLISQCSYSECPFKEPKTPQAV